MTEEIKEKEVNFHTKKLMETINENRAKIEKKFKFEADLRIKKKELEEMENLQGKDFSIQRAEKIALANNVIVQAERYKRENLEDGEIAVQKLKNGAFSFLRDSLGADKDIKEMGEKAVSLLKEVLDLKEKYIELYFEKKKHYTKEALDLGCKDLGVKSIEGYFQPDLFPFRALDSNAKNILDNE